MLLFVIPNPPRYRYFVKRWQRDGGVGCCSQFSFYCTCEAPAPSCTKLTPL